MQLQLPQPQTQSSLADEDLFKFTSGPRDAELMLVGECWGSSEAAAQRPFVGSSGQELDRMLGEAGLDRKSILCTNVVHQQPPGNDFTYFLYQNSEKGVAYDRGLKGRDQLKRGVANLYSLIERVKPKLIIAAGNVPLWSLSDHASTPTKAGYKVPSGIASWRGSQTYTRPIHGRSYSLLPIIHPAAILREWGFRAPTVHDLRRAKAFLEGSHWEARKTNTKWQASFQEIHLQLEAWIKEANSKPEGLWLSVDLETSRRKFISILGIADEKTELCIRLYQRSNNKTTNIFSSSQEIYIFETVKRLLEHPNLKIIGQNFIYDTEFLHRTYNITALVAFDTMVAHHLLFPGTKKSLEYLASLYLPHYIYWKDEGQDWDGDIGETKWKYNCKDVRHTYDIAMVLRRALTQLNLNDLYLERLEQWKLSRTMSLNGVNFDTNLQKEMRLQLLDQANDLSDWLLNAVPDSWRYTSTGKPWYNSPKGTHALLYTCLKLTPVLHKKTKRPTTDDAALQEISEREVCRWLEPLFARLRHLRSLGVFISHFLDARTGPLDRIYCSFNIAHPETFRWSSNANPFGEGTNLQNIPKGDKDDPDLTIIDGTAEEPNELSDL